MEARNWSIFLPPCRNDHSYLHLHFSPSSSEVIVHPFIISKWIHMQPAQAAITKYHRLGLKHRNDFSQFWRLRNPRSRYQPIRILGRALFLAYRQLASCCVLKWWRERWGERERGREGTDVSSSYKGTNPIMRTPPPWPHINLNYIPKMPPPNTITLGVRVSTYEFGGGGHKHSVYNNMSTEHTWMLSTVLSLVLRD